MASPPEYPPPGVAGGAPSGSTLTFASLPGFPRSPESAARSSSSSGSPPSSAPPSGLPRVARQVDPSVEAAAGAMKGPGTAPPPPPPKVAPTPIRCSFQTPPLPYAASVAAATAGRCLNCLCHVNGIGGGGGGGMAAASNNNSSVNANGCGDVNHFQSGAGKAFSRGVEGGSGFQPMPPTRPPSVRRYYRQCHGGPVKYDHCVFCKNNGEDPTYYTTHTLKDDINGGVRCPVLQAYRCPICGATGKAAHTLRYCPENRSCHQQQQPRPPMPIVTTSISSEADRMVYTEEATISELKRMRSATGRTRPLLARATTSAGGGGGATFGVLQHSHAGGRQQQEQHCQQHQGPASPTKFGPIGSGRFGCHGGGGDGGGSAFSGLPRHTPKVAITPSFSSSCFPYGGYRSARLGSDGNADGDGPLDTPGGANSGAGGRYSDPFACQVDPAVAADAANSPLLVPLPAAAAAANSLVSHGRGPLDEEVSVRLAEFFFRPSF